MWTANPGQGFDLGINDFVPYEKVQTETPVLPLRGRFKPWLQQTQPSREGGSRPQVTSLSASGNRYRF